MTVQILHVLQGFIDVQDFARVMTSTRGISRFGDRLTAESYLNAMSVRKPRIRAKGTWKIAKLDLKLGRCRASIRVRLYCCELSNSQDSIQEAPASNESYKDDFYCGVIIPKQLPQSQHNHGRMYQINLDKVIDNIMRGDIPKNCETQKSTTIACSKIRSCEMPIE